MVWWGWVANVAGALLVLSMILEVLVTVLHSDADGPAAQAVHRALWRIVMIATRSPGPRRRVALSMAAPLMMMATLVLWVSLFILGFALVYWPHLEHGFVATRSGAVFRGFVDALYMSGVTGTVLGYGDITPAAGWLKVLCVTQSAIGFALLSGIVAWFVGIVGGLHDRIALAARLHDASGGTDDGVELLIRLVRTESPSMTHARLLSIDAALQALGARFRQYPILDIYYRSRRPHDDPEVMLRTLADATAAGRLLGEDPRFSELRAAFEDLDRTLVGVFRHVADQYLPRTVRAALASPSPDAPDRGHLAAIEARLARSFERLSRSDADESRANALELVHRARVTLDALDELTGWRSDQR
jgi:hypothetical protein